MDFDLTGFSTSENNSQPGEAQHIKLMVLGSGPAGLAAALYAARAEMSPVVLTGMEFGGQAALTHTIENYPGFPEGVGGSELGELFRKQAERFGARVEYDTATEVDLTQRPFVVRTYSNEYRADSLIVSTGATPVRLGIPGETDLTGRGVSYCATCDGWFFKEKDVIVVGGGDSALEEGLFLTRYAKSVTVIHRRDTLRAGAVLQKRAKEHPKMKFIWNTVVTDIIGKDAVQAVCLQNRVTGETSEMPTDGIFVFIGHTPNTQLFQGKLDLDERGYVKTGVTMETNVPGVFVAGEAGDPHYRQVVTSAGMGAAAAIQAVRFLEEHSG